MAVNPLTRFHKRWLLRVGDMALLSGITLDPDCIEAFGGIPHLLLFPAGGQINYNWIGSPPGLEPQGTSVIMSGSVRTTSLSADFAEGRREVYRAVRRMANRSLQTRRAGNFVPVTLLDFAYPEEVDEDNTPPNTEPYTIRYGVCRVTPKGVAVGNNIGAQFIKDGFSIEFQDSTQREVF